MYGGAWVQVAISIAIQSRALYGDANIHSYACTIVPTRENAYYMQEFV